MEHTSSGPMSPGRRQRRRPLSTRIPYAAPDLLLKHLDATVVTYKRRQMKHLKQASETLAKRLKTFENHCKHMQHPKKQLQTYV
jgi:hypothetical protein